MKYEVVIIGSGPAGASAAFCLATEGVRVAVLERESLPRYKTCGGGVSRRALRLMPVNILDVVERDCFVAEINLLDAHLHFETARITPIISMTMRERLDSLLLSAAGKAGAHIRPCCKLLDLVVHHERVDLITSNGQISARFVIGADGAMSTVARKTRRPDNRRFIPAFEYEVFVDNKLFERFARSARFDFGMVPHGYGWVFPKKEHLSVGLLTMRHRSASLHENINSYLRLLGITRVLRMERHGSVIPVVARCAPPATDKIILVGDAAGFVDPVTCEGITYAVRSGQIAARSLVDGNFEQDAVSRTYNADIAAAIMPEIETASRLATILYDHPKLRTMLFRMYGQKFVEAVTDIIIGERTYRQLVNDPANYLKLLKPRRQNRTQ